MKKRERKQERPQALKRKFMSALAMLLISTILMTTTSYAWFVLSTAPEVTGIETQVGANGSLEIALLNTETRADMSTIRAGLGGSSLQAGHITANNAWGNLVDLGHASYGLGELILLPARLDVSANAGGYSVDLNKLLAVPTYGYDGRVIDLNHDTSSAIYKETGFLYSGAQDYGVRAIGTSDALSAQGSALVSAKSNISTYTKSAKANTQATLVANGDGLFDIVLKYAEDSLYDDTDRDNLKLLLTDLDGVLDYIDLSLRQGLVAYAASALSDEDTFTDARDTIMNTEKPLSEILPLMAEFTTVPETLNEWVAQLETMQNKLNFASNSCDALSGGTYEWDQIKPILISIMDVDYVYIEGDLIANLNQENLMNKVMGGEAVEMTLAPGSGLFADIADFTENFEVIVQYKFQGMVTIDIEMATASAVRPAHLIVLGEAVNELEPADGGEQSSALPLTATYGYAIDLAFRCNAVMPDLVLQTAGVQRVYNGGESEDDIVSDNGTSQGGGSYMEFSSLDENFTLEQQLKLMDAIRVGFLDDTGNVMAIAKLNVTGRESVDGVVKAPLYLYDYTYEKDETGYILTMGERRLVDNLITPLEQNVAKAVTVVVWLDGDIVDNTYVSATKSTSLNGVLNLQFATSAELVPAVDGSILKYTADKAGLEEAVSAFAEIAAAGQGTNTNVSWNAFITAYNRAVAVKDNDNASVIEVRNAVNNLTASAAALEAVSTEAISAKINAIRELMGTTDETVRYVVDDGENGYVAMGSQEHTQEEHDGWNQVGTINRVDFNNNMFDEGNGIYTTLYSDESWNALANALYEAEAVLMNPNATDDQINAALTALENAEKALTRQVFFTPYEYNGKIYYEAKCDAENEDTYGKWYDSEFNRIVADVTILNLDAYAEPATVTQMGQGLYVASDTDYITPDIDFLEEVFPELRDVEVMGVHWNEIDTNLFTEMMMDQHYNKLQELTNIADTDLILDLIATSENPDNSNFGDTQWLPSNQTASGKTAAGTKWAQIRDSEGVPVYRAICGKEEHTAHENICYKKTCAMDEHTHDEYCTADGCQFEEHAHGDACYDRNTLICTKELHTHTDSCKEYKWQVIGEDYVAPEYFTTANTNAKALMAKWENNQEVTAAEAEKAIADLNNAIVQLYEENMALLEEHENADMTANQRILLTAAVNAAKTVEGYDSNAALKAATQRAENILAGEGVPTRVVAAEALVELNEQLTAVDATAISEYNTLTHKVPDGFGSSDIIYDVDYPGIKLKLTGATGHTMLDARILTTDGVVVNVSKQITVYDKIQSVSILRDGTEVNSLSLATEETGTFAAMANYAQLSERIHETPASYTWASSDPSVISVTLNPDGTAAFTAVNSGTAVVNVSIATVEGNAYACEIPVIVGNVQKASYISITANSFYEVADEPAAFKAELVYDGEPAAGYFREEVKSYNFISGNQSVFAVENKGDGNAVLTPVAPGAAQLTVRITTVEGSTYEETMRVFVECDYIADVTFKVDGGDPVGSGDVLTLGLGESVVISQDEIYYEGNQYPYKEQIAGYDYFTNGAGSVSVTNNGDGTFTITAETLGEDDVGIKAIPESGSVSHAPYSGIVFTVKVTP